MDYKSIDDNSLFEEISQEEDHSTINDDLDLNRTILTSDNYANIDLNNSTLADSTTQLTKGNLEVDEDDDEFNNGSFTYKLKNLKFQDFEDFEDDTPNIENSKQPEEPPQGWKGFKFYVSLSGYWFAYAAVMSALISIVWPSQIAYLGGQENKEKYVGFIPILGVSVSIFISPLAGVMSDYTTGRYGKRRIYIVIGSLISITFLIFTSFSTNIYLFMIFLMGIQLGMNLGGTPYSSLMPDLIPKSKYGLASGYLALANALGNLFGVLGSGISLTIKKSYPMVYIFIVIIFICTTLPTIFGIKEQPVIKSRDSPKLTIKTFFKSFHLPYREYRDFYWVILTRFLQEMGIYTILPFVQYYLSDIIHVPSDKSEFYASVFISIIVITSIPSSMIGGPLSDKYGRKPLVYISSAIMAVVTLGFILIGLRPNVTVVLILSGLFGVGYGSYQGVDYALALDVLPENSNTAKDLGIWHQTMVVPQLFAPALAGLIVDSFKKSGNITLGYTMLYSLACLWFILATVMIRPIRIGKKEDFIRLQPK